MAVVITMSTVGGKGSIAWVKILTLDWYTVHHLPHQYIVDFVLGSEECNFFNIEQYRKNNHNQYRNLLRYIDQCACYVPGHRNTEISSEKSRRRTFARKQNIDVACKYNSVWRSSKVNGSWLRTDTYVAVAFPVRSVLITTLFNRCRTAHFYTDTSVLLQRIVW